MDLIHLIHHQRIAEGSRLWRSVAAGRRKEGDESIDQGQRLHNSEFWVENCCSSVWADHTKTSSRRERFQRYRAQLRVIVEEEAVHYYSYCPGSVPVVCVQGDNFD